MKTLQANGKRAFLEFMSYNADVNKDRTKKYGRALFINNTFLDVANEHDLYFVRVVKTYKNGLVAAYFSDDGDALLGLKNLTNEKLCQIFENLKPGLVEFDCSNFESEELLNLVKAVKGKARLDACSGGYVFSNEFWPYLSGLTCRVRLPSIQPIAENSLPKKLDLLHVEEIEDYVALTAILEQPATDLHLDFNKWFGGVDENKTREISNPATECHLFFEDVFLICHFTDVIQKVISSCKQLEKLTIVYVSEYPLVDYYGRVPSTKTVIKRFVETRNMVIESTEAIRNALPNVKLNIHFKLRCDDETLTLSSNWQKRLKACDGFENMEFTNENDDEDEGFGHTKALIFSEKDLEIFRFSIDIQYREYLVDSDDDEDDTCTEDPRDYDSEYSYFNDSD